MIEVYGIPNCDTVKKSTNWLKENGLEFVFHNFKQEIPTATMLEAWAKQVPLEILINKKSTTWKALTPEQQQLAGKKSTAFPLLMAHTSLIKRPVVAWPNGTLTVGFTPKMFEEKEKG